MDISRDELKARYAEASQRLTGRLPTEKEIDDLNKTYQAWLERTRSWGEAENELVFEKAADGTLDISFRRTVRAQQQEPQ